MYQQFKLGRFRCEIAYKLPAYRYLYGYTLIYQVVKAFIILAEGHKHRDLEKLTYELQEMVKSITAPYKYPRKVCSLI